MYLAKKIGEDNVNDPTVVLDCLLKAKQQRHLLIKPLFGKDLVQFQYRLNDLCLQWGDSQSGTVLYSQFF